MVPCPRDTQRTLSRSVMHCTSTPRLIRRLERDIKERGRTSESVIEQYLETVRPMHKCFVEPSKEKADIIVPFGLNSVALDMIISRLRFAAGS